VSNHRLKYNHYLCSSNINLRPLQGGSSSAEHLDSGVLHPQQDFMEFVQQMVSRHPSSYKGSDCYRTTGRTILWGAERREEQRRPERECSDSRTDSYRINPYYGGHQDVKRTTYLSEEPKLPEASGFGGESEGTMLDISGLQQQIRNLRSYPDVLGYLHKD